MLADDDWDGWQGAFCTGLAQVPDNAAMVLGWDDGDAMAFAALDRTEMDEFGEVQRMIRARRRQVLAMATRIAWAQLPEEDTTDAWIATIVTPHREAAFYVKRFAEDDHWWQLPPDGVPWAVLSTAGSLRGVLDGKAFPPIKSVSDGRLLKRPDEEPQPPVDETGRL